MAPSSFQGPASALKTLIMHGNRIERLPDGMFTGMTSLLVLNLNENMLEYVPYDFLKDCGELVEVSFYKNALVSIDGAKFENLK